jgi:heme-degrading monooxygenase HmoA
MAFYRVIVLKWNQDLQNDELRAVARRVQTDLVPILKAQPGFISYHGFVAQEQPRTSVAVTVWESAAQAGAGTEATAAWTEQVAGRYLESREMLSGDVIMSS